MKYVLRYFLCILVLCACVYAAQARFGKGQGAYVQTIGSIVYSGATATPGLANTPLGSASVTMFQTTPVFSGTCSLSGTNASSFTINSSTCALRVGAANLAFGVYSFNIVATEAGIANSPLSLPVSIGVPAWYVAQSTRCANANGGSGTQATCALPVSYTGDTLVVMPDWCEAAPCASGTAVRPSSVTINNGTATCTEISGALTPTSGSAIHGADAWLCSNLSAAADSVKVVYPSSVGRADLNIQELYGCAPACIAEGGHGIQIPAPAGSSPSISLGSATTAAFDLILSFLGSGDGAGLSAGACCTALTGDAGNLSEFQIGATAQSYTNSAVYTGSALAYGTIAAFKQTTSPPLVASPNVISPTSFSVVSNAPAGTLVGTITATTVPNYFFVGEMLLATNVGGYLVLGQSATQPNMATLKVANGVTMTAGTYTDTVQLIENGVTVNQNFTLTVTSPQTIASITCSGCSTSFTAGVPNGVVGNVTVTMSPASPAFSGALSITGTNSGGFQLSGTSSGSNLLQSSIGTPAGTYTNTNIVGTQAGIGNSPQQITPTLTGVASGVQPPAQATVAGFTTCIICFDFTNTAGGGVFVNGAAVPSANPSQTSTWLDCAGASSPIWFQDGVFFYLPTPPPCPTITTDAGTQVMFAQFRPSDYLNGPTNFSNTNGVVTLGRRGLPGIMLPTNHYMEFVVKVTSFPSNGYFEGPWEGSGGFITDAQGQNRFEFDAFEINPGNSPGSMISATHNWNPTTCPGGCGAFANWQGTFPPQPPGNTFDITSGYHNIGMRITSDGTNTIYKCMWLDGVFQNCIHLNLGDFGVQAYQLSDATSRIDGLFDPVGANQANNIASPMTSFTKSINIWSCANWQTTACSTPGNPDPGGF